MTETTTTKIEISSWTDSRGNHRRYVNNWTDLIGLYVDRYKSGNIRDAALNDNGISNAEAGRILCAKVWIDDNDRVHVDHWAGREITADQVAEIVSAAYLASLPKPEPEPEPMAEEPLPDEPVDVDADVDEEDEADETSDEDLLALAVKKATEMVGSGGAAKVREALDAAGASRVRELNKDNVREFFKALS